MDRADNSRGSSALVFSPPRTRRVRVSLRAMYIIPHVILETRGEIHHRLSGVQVVEHLSVPATILAD